MTLGIRPAVAWALLLAVPFYVSATAYLHLLGPAHFHFDGEMHEDAHEHFHAHGHDRSERHHHHADDASVVTVEDDASLASHAPEESSPSGWSGTLYVVLVSAGATMLLPRLANGIFPGREPLLHTRFLGRLERPPRIERA
jgi:hypothetical protein